MKNKVKLLVVSGLLMLAIYGIVLQAQTQTGNGNWRGTMSPMSGDIVLKTELPEAPATMPMYKGYRQWNRVFLPQARYDARKEEHAVRKEGDRHHEGMLRKVWKVYQEMLCLQASKPTTYME